MKKKVLLQINDTAASTSLKPSPSLFDVPYQSDQLMYRVSSICSSTRSFCSLSRSFCSRLRTEYFSIAGIGDGGGLGRADGGFSTRDDASFIILRS
jgi:hypothetical protein